jgi:CHASE2 domain-containing sensor protein
MHAQSPTLRKVKRWLRRRGTFLFATVVALFMALTYLILSAFPGGETYEVASVDTWFSLRGNQAAPSGVLLATIDKRTYRDLHLSSLEPWPRRINTELLKRFKRGGARLVVFDIFFVDKGPDALIDQEMSEALALLPTFIGSYSTKLSAKDTFRTTIRPQDQFSKNAHSVVDMSVVHGGPVRGFFVQDLANFYPSHRSIDLPLANAIAQFHQPPLVVPDKRDLIWFYGPPGSFPGVSVSEILSMTDETLVSRFKDAIVIVGSQMEVDGIMKLKDSFETSVSKSFMSGVEIHANVVANIIHQQWIKRFPKSLEEIITAALAYLLPFLILISKPIRATTLAVTTIVMWCLTSYLLFTQGYHLPGRIITTLLLPLSLFISITYFYLVLRSSINEVSDALGVDISE